VEKIIPKVGLLLKCSKNCQKEHNGPIGENSPNLVTLLLSNNLLPDIFLIASLFFSLRIFLSGIFEPLFRYVGIKMIY
jgi:hypothetical protein